ncbi:MAG: RNA 2'-phosphotransferase [Thermodesulfobacteriota bacterium]
MSKNNTDKIGKILEYVLSISPDEFFLIPDSDGYVKIKELLKAVHEKKELRWISKAEISAYTNISPDPLVEINGNFIRAAKRANTIKHETADNLPGQLFTAIRKKAWPHISEKGIYPKDNQTIMLTDKYDDALILGKRKDNDPVVLSVSTKNALKENIKFISCGQGLYTVDFLKPELLNGPSVEKAEEEIKTKNVQKKSTPGTFSPNTKDLFPETKTEKSWKKNKKKIRREKKNFWPDQ